MHTTIIDLAKKAFSVSESRTHCRINPKPGNDVMLAMLGKAMTQ